MLKNSFIPLSPSSSLRLNAENSIKYTLLLNYKLPYIGNTDSIQIEKIMDACQKCCYEIFSDNPEFISYDFFGTPHSYEQDTLTFLQRYPVPKEKKELPSGSIHEMILQNCVMSSYHAILSELLHDVPVTAYQTANTFKFYGINSLYEKNCLDFTHNGIKIYKKNFVSSNLSNKEKNSFASSFHRAFTGHSKATNGLMDFILNEQNQRQFQFQFFQLCHSFLRLRPSELKYLFAKEDSVKSSSTFFTILNECIQKLTPPIYRFSDIPSKNFEQFGGNVVDGIYQYYLSERIFNFNLLYSLFKNIETSSKKTYYQFNDSEVLNILATCKKLPNPFSRTYFLRFAFDHINVCNSYTDFWHYHDISQRDVFVGSTRKIPKGFHFEKWLEEYRLFIELMSTYVIPIYDWCFFSILISSIENRYPEKNHREHLKDGLIILSNYIKQNYRSILQPIKLTPKSAMDGLDMISSKKYDTLIDSIDIASIKTIKNIFFRSDEYLDLNFQPIEPALFRGKFPQNMRDLQNFYLDLIFSPIS